MKRSFVTWNEITFQTAGLRKCGVHIEGAFNRLEDQFGCKCAGALDLVEYCNDRRLLAPNRRSINLVDVVADVLGQQLDQVSKS